MATHLLLLALIANSLHTISALSAAQAGEVHQNDTAVVAPPSPVLVIGRFKSCNVSEQSELTTASAVLAVDCGFALHTGVATDSTKRSDERSPGTATRSETQGIDDAHEAAA